MGTHTHKVPCAELDPPLLIAQMGTEAREVVRHLMPLSPSQGTLTVPLKKSQPLPHQVVQQKTNEHKQTIVWERKLRSRAAPGGMQAAWGRASLAHDHSKAELVPVLQKGLDLGGANPQPLLQQRLPGHIHPVPVCLWTARVQCQWSCSTGHHCLSRGLTPFKMKPAEGCQKDRQLNFTSRGSQGFMWLRIHRTTKVRSLTQQPPSSQPVPDLSPTWPSILQAC